ncbi:MAG: hypothetical protein ACKN9T_07355 [Candidatus Methylumidiphilus sp.]
MKNIHFRVLCVLALSFFVNVSFAGGRYANPPKGLLETTEACTKGLEAAEKGDTAAALEQAKTGRKIALESYKELSTMPMEIGSSTMKKAIAALEAGNVAEAKENFAHCKKKMEDEIAYYKNEGKL